MDSSLAETLKDRARRAGLDLPERLIGPFLAYFDVLARWNRTINLTALSDPAAAIDRLLLEPFAAAASLPCPARLIDLGSGGGSPAIPLALATGASELVMIESRSRKAAFLREAARVVEISAVVETARFEEIAAAPAYRGSAPLVSMRAVRLDEASASAVASLLTPSGQFAFFTSALTAVPAGFVEVSHQTLIADARLQIFAREGSTWNMPNRLC